MADDIPRPDYDRDVKKLVEAYKKAIDDIRAELNSLDPESISRANAEAALAVISERLKELNDTSADMVQAMIPEAMTNGVATALTALGTVKTFEEAQKVARFNKLNSDLVKTIIADTQSDLLQVTQNVERRVRNAVRQAVSESLRANIAKGINGRRTISRDVRSGIRTRLGDSADTAIVDRAGRRWTVANYTDMVVRTKMMYAHMEATTNEAIERGVMYGTISSHGAKDGCGQYEGKVVKLVQDAPGDYPSVDALRASGAIFHPNCKHVITPKRYPESLPKDQHKGSVERTVSQEEALQPPSKSSYTTSTQDLRLPTGETRPTYVYHYPAENVKLIVPVDMDWSKQRYSLDQIFAAYDALPIKLRAAVTEIKLLDGRNELDSYWEKQYGMKNFRSYATGGTGQINFFANDNHSKQTADDYLAHVMPHEAAHNLDWSLRTADANNKWYSDGPEWAAARDADKKLSAEAEFTSDYARTSKAVHEDFADGVSGYINDNSYFKWKYPNRTNLLEALLHGKGTKRTK